MIFDNQQLKEVRKISTQINEFRGFQFQSKQQNIVKPFTPKLPDTLQSRHYNQLIIKKQCPRPVTTSLKNIKKIHINDVQTCTNQQNDNQERLNYFQKSETSLIHKFYTQPHIRQKVIENLEKIKLQTNADVLEQLNDKKTTNHINNDFSINNYKKKIKIFQDEKDSEHIRIYSVDKNSRHHLMQNTQKIIHKKDESLLNKFKGRKEQRKPHKPQVEQKLHNTHFYKQEVQLSQAELHDQLVRHNQKNQELILAIIKQNKSNREQMLYEQLKDRGPFDPNKDIYERKQVLTTVQISDHALESLKILHEQLDSMKTRNKTQQEIDFNNSIQEQQDKIMQSISNYMQMKQHMIKGKVSTGHHKELIYEQFTSQSTLIMGHDIKAQSKNLKNIQSLRKAINLHTNLSSMKKHNKILEKPWCDEKGFQWKDKQYVYNKRNIYLNDIIPYRKYLLELYQKYLTNSSEHRATRDDLKDFFMANDAAFDEMDVEEAIGQIPIGDELNLYDRPNNLTEQLKEHMQGMVKLFHKYRLEDEQETARLLPHYEKIMSNFLNVKNNILNSFEIKTLLTQYNNKITKPNDRNYEIIDDIALKLTFMKKFTKATRLYLLQYANIIFYDSGVTIFKQEDIGDLMYIIIKGGCHVRINRRNTEGKIENVVVVTLYDGTQFGDLSFINKQNLKGLTGIIKKNEIDEQMTTFNDLKRELVIQQSEKKVDEEEKQDGKKIKYVEKQDEIITLLQNAAQQSARRAATIETCEPTYLFTLQKEYFVTVILKMIQIELGNKIKFLKMLPFYQDYNVISLIPLANMLEERNFKLGETIIRSGVTPTEFFIIIKGKAKIIKEQIIARDAYLMSNESEKQRLIFSKIDYKDCMKKAKEFQEEEGENIKFEEFDANKQSLEDYQARALLQKQKIQKYQKIEQKDPEKFLFTFYHEYGSLGVGEHFLSRAILAEYCRIDDTLKKHLRYDVFQETKLAIISDSSITQLYSLENTAIHRLEAGLRRVLIEGLLQFKDFDHEYDEQSDLMTKQWDSYKLEVMKETQYTII